MPKVSILRSVPVLSLLMAFSCMILPAPSHAATQPAITTPPAAATPVPQVADEITRRLKRMGVEVLRDRDIHPYDGPGELCMAASNSQPLA